MLKTCLVDWGWRSITLLFPLSIGHNFDILKQAFDLLIVMKVRRKLHLYKIIYNLAMASGLEI